MNIFVVHTDPKIAAMHLHDRHVVKMILESGQLLCTTRRLLGDDDVRLFKSCFVNHPCTKWVRESLSNYIWLCQHMRGLCSEYTYRYGKTHRTESLLPVLSRPLESLEDKGLTPFALAMPDEYRTTDPVLSYRRYYLGKKIENNHWTKRLPGELDDWLTSQLHVDQFRTRD